jgi:transcriptional regulator with XRE-family HTH domain
MTRLRALVSARPSLAPRTRLYHLEPEGVGTAAVESLSGYLMRLAEAHCISTGALVSEELLPLLQPDGRHGLPPATWLGRVGSQMNGTGDVAQAAVAALASLTGRQELSLLTLVPWAPVVAPHGLLRYRKRTRAWCSACYTDALEQGTALYEPLLWSIAAVTACARHQLPLTEHCPYADCGRQLPVLAALARPGHCSWCKRVLVRADGPPGVPRSGGREMQWACWATEQVGELLAASALAAVSAPIGIAAALAAITAAASGGTHQAFARAVGIHANLVHRWRTERTRPTMSMLLQMCHALDVSLVQLVTGDVSALAKTGISRSATVRPPEKTPRRSPAVLDVGHLRQEMSALCSNNESPPPSGEAIARRLDCPTAALSRFCPDDWHALVARYRIYRTEQREQRAQALAADVRQAMRQVDAQGLYPSFKRLRPLLHQRLHPRRTDVYIIRHQVLQELGWSLTGVRSQIEGQVCSQEIEAQSCSLCKP